MSRSTGVTAITIFSLENELKYYKRFIFVKCGFNDKVMYFNLTEMHKHLGKDVYYCIPGM